MVYGDRVDPFAEFKKAHEEYRVYDIHYESLGKADELFVDGADQPLYIGVKTGLLEAKSVVVPLEIVRINDKRQVVEISREADQVRHAPSLGDHEDLTPDLEARIHGYFGLANPPTPEEEHHAASHSGLLLEEEFAPDTRIDVEPGERQETAGRFEEAPPTRASETDEPRDLPPRRDEQVSPPKEAGREWAPDAERLSAGDRAEGAAANTRMARARRLRR